MTFTTQRRKAWWWSFNSPLLLLLRTNDSCRQRLPRSMALSHLIDNCPPPLLWASPSITHPCIVPLVDITIVNIRVPTKSSKGVPAKLYSKKLPTVIPKWNGQGGVKIKNWYTTLKNTHSNTEMKFRYRRKFRLVFTDTGQGGGKESVYNTIFYRFI